MWLLVSLSLFAGSDSTTSLCEVQEVQMRLFAVSLQQIAVLSLILSIYERVVVRIVAAPSLQQANAGATRAGGPKKIAVKKPPKDHKGIRFPPYYYEDKQVLRSICVHVHIYI
jgi:hypothetical protein